MANNPNAKWPTKTTAPDANYPYGSAQNISVPGDGTGTPWVKDMTDDIFGMQQQLLDAASIVPTNTPDKVGASQYYEAMQKSFGNPGEIVAWASTANPDPSSLNVRLLPLTGQGILRANYADLDTVVYVGDGNNATAPAFYRADDAAGTIRNTGGIYLILPDFRGYVLRGLDTAALVDPDGASRKVGDAQDWAVKKHDHYVEPVSANDYMNLLFFSITPGGSTYEVPYTASGVPAQSDLLGTEIDIGTVPTANQSDDETRMTNVSVHWCIRF
jgi:hypothetical protein